MKTCAEQQGGVAFACQDALRKLRDAVSRPFVAKVGLSLLAEAVIAAGFIQVRRRLKGQHRCSRLKMGT